MKADVFELGVIDRGLVAMAGSAEADLREGGHFAGIGDRALTKSVGGSTGMTARALHAGEDRLQIRSHASGMTSDAIPQGLMRLDDAESGLSICGSPTGLADCDAKPLQTGKVADVRFKHAAAGGDERSLTLRAGAHHPFDNSGGVVRTTASFDLDGAEGRELVGDGITLIGLVQRLAGQVGSEGA